MTYILKVRNSEFSEIFLRFLIISEECRKLSLIMSQIILCSDSIKPYLIVNNLTYATKTIILSSFHSIIRIEHTSYLIPMVLSFLISLEYHYQRILLKDSISGRFCCKDVHGKVISDINVVSH
jgi:hypothetical protein